MSSKEKKPEVKVNESGQIRVAVPVTDHTESNLSITPGSHEHEVLVESHSATEPQPETNTHPQEAERRRQQTPVQVQVQPGIPGLPGWNGVFAQWGAVGFLFVLTYLMWNTISSNAKEDRALLREEMRSIKDELRVATVAADKRDLAFITVMNGNATKYDTVNTNILNAIIELKEAKRTMEVKLDKIYEALKLKLDERNQGVKNGCSTYQFVNPGCGCCCHVHSG